MSNDGVDWYLESIARVPLLTADQEITLGRQVQEWMALKEFLQKQEQKAAAELKAQSSDQQLDLIDLKDFDDESEQQLAISKLTAKQQRKIMRDGKRALDHMYAANLRLVVSIAKKYAGLAKHLEFMDLVQEGSLGLHRAVEKFDPGRGYKFSTYAYWWIRQGITRGIQQSDFTITIPNGAYEKIGKIRHFSRDYNQQFGYMPSSQLICDEFNLKPKDLDRLTTVAMGCRSLHEHCSQGSSEHSMLMDIIAAPEQDEQAFDCIEQQIVEEALPKIKEQMTEMEGKVFEASFFTQRQDSRAQIARELGITGERARQLENRSTKRFKLLFKLRYEATAC